MLNQWPCKNRNVLKIDLSYQKSKFLDLTGSLLRAIIYFTQSFLLFCVKNVGEKKLGKKVLAVIRNPAKSEDVILDLKSFMGAPIF